MTFFEIVTFNTSQNIVDYYIKFQNQVIKSIHSTYIPILETTNNICLTNQTFCDRIFEIYSESSIVFTENTVALGKMINELAKANIFAYNNLFNITKESLT